MPSAHGVKRCPAAAVVASALFLAAPVARADEPPPVPPANSGISQYVEQVPSSGGATAPGITKSTKAKLPSHVSRRLRREGGKDAALLDEVATASALGAPGATPGSKTHGSAAPGSTRSPQRSGRSGSPLAAGPVAASDRGTSHTPLLVLLGVVLASTLALGAGWLRARRGSG